jgi:hypothetical protein
MHFAAVHESGSGPTETCRDLSKYPQFREGADLTLVYRPRSVVRLQRCELVGRTIKGRRNL